jgi:hypothetical protein
MWKILLLCEKKCCGAIIIMRCKYYHVDKKCDHLDVIPHDNYISLSCGATCYHMEQMLSCGIKYCGSFCYHVISNVIRGS